MLEGPTEPCIGGWLDLITYKERLSPVSEPGLDAHNICKERRSLALKAILNSEIHEKSWAFDMKAGLDWTVITCVESD